MAKTPSQTTAKAKTAREVAAFHRTLRMNRQVVPAGTPLPEGATHVERKNRKGQVQLVRKRFAAI